MFTNVSARGRHFGFCRACPRGSALVGTPATILIQLPLAATRRIMTTHWGVAQLIASARFPSSSRPQLHLTRSDGAVSQCDDHRTSTGLSLFRTVAPIYLPLSYEISLTAVDTVQLDRLSSGMLQSCESNLFFDCACFCMRRRVRWLPESRV